MRDLMERCVDEFEVYSLFFLLGLWDMVAWRWGAVISVQIDYRTTGE